MSALDLETFEGWMRQIMERFDRNERLLASLTGKELKEVKYLDGERLLDNQDLCELLNTSKRSIQRYRSSGTLKYRMLWHKVYYKESDVQEFFEDAFQRVRAEKRSKGWRGITPQTSMRKHKLPRPPLSIAERFTALTFAAEQFH